MFFRREKPHVDTFNEHMDKLRKAGYTVQPETGGGTRATKGGCAAVLKDNAGSTTIAAIGVVIGNEIGQLCDAGYQKYWLTASGTKAPATADHLKALHAFEEDLREALEIDSLYNQSLGSTNELHLYDRVKDRDHGVQKRPWER